MANYNHDLVAENEPYRSKEIAELIRLQKIENRNQRLGDILNGVQYLWHNFTPFGAGYFATNSAQKYIQDNPGRWFRMYRPAIGGIVPITLVGVMAATVGLNLLGIDVGTVIEVNRVWTTSRQYVSFISEYLQPLLPFLDLRHGIPQEITRPLSLYFLGDSIIRALHYYIMREPLGPLPLEISSRIFEKITFIGSKKRERELSQIISAQEQREKKLSNKDIRETEGAIASAMRELYASNNLTEEKKKKILAERSERISRLLKKK